MPYMNDHEEIITIALTLPVGKLVAVYALLGGVAAATITRGTSLGESLAQMDKSNVKAPEPAAAAKGAEPLAVEQTAGDAGLDAELDADGHPWSAALHASTKAKTGAGLWRMKPGASRPAPLPGFPKADGTSTANGGSQAPESASGAAGSAAAEDDDEFAAFNTANQAGGGAAAPTARTWSDADLSKLNNQAAVKLGSPDKVKATLGGFIPEGAVAHSRNIPADQREAYAQAIEKVAGIEFEG